MVGGSRIMAATKQTTEGYVMKRDTIANLLGASSTGTAHSLLVERERDGSVRFTVVGHDGKKRHAAVILPSAVAESLATSLQAAIWEDN